MKLKKKTCALILREMGPTQSGVFIREIEELSDLLSSHLRDDAAPRTPRRDIVEALDAARKAMEALRDADALPLLDDAMQFSGAVLFHEERGGNLPIIADAESLCRGLLEAIEATQAALPAGKAGQRHLARHRFTRTLCRAWITACNEPPPRYVGGAFDKVAKAIFKEIAERYDIKTEAPESFKNDLGNLPKWDHLKVKNR